MKVIKYKIRLLKKIKPKAISSKLVDKQLLRQKM